MDNNEQSSERMQRLEDLTHLTGDWIEKPKIFWSGML